MDRIRIVGGAKLNGTIPISGAKNAALPLMIASLLTPETLVLENVPRLSDVRMLKRILGNHGVDVMVAGKRVGERDDDGETVKLNAGTIVDTTAPYDSCRRCARASGSLRRFLRAWARRRCRCPVAAPSARAPSISC